MIETETQPEPLPPAIGSTIDHNARRRKRCRWGLRVKWIGGEWMDTACRFDPDTAETARTYGEKGIKDGRHIEAFEVVDRRSPNDQAER